MSNEQEAEFMRFHRSVRNVVIVVIVAAACFAVLVS